MITANDMVHELSLIRGALDNLEVKGRVNADYYVYAYDKCTMLINEVNKIIENIQNEGSESDPTNEKSPNEEGE